MTSLKQREAKLHKTFQFTYVPIIRPNCDLLIGAQKMLYLYNSLLQVQILKQKQPAHVHQTVPPSRWLRVATNAVRLVTQGHKKM